MLEGMNVVVRTAVALLELWHWHWDRGRWARGYYSSSAVVFHWGVELFLSLLQARSSVAS